MVVAYLCENTGASQGPESWKADDYFCIRMPLEGFGAGRFEILRVSAGRFQLPKQGCGLLPEGLLDQRQMVQVLALEDFVESIGLGVNSSEAASTFEESPQLTACELGSLSRGGGGGKNCAGLVRGQSVLVVREGVQDRRVELAQLGTELVLGLVAIPDRVLLGPREHGDRLRKL